MYKEYQYKVVVSGDITEIYAYDEELLKKLEDDEKAKSKIAKKKIKVELIEDEEKSDLITASESMNALAKQIDDEFYEKRKANVNRTKLKLKRIIYANVGQYRFREKFITLTFKEYKERDDVVYCFKKFKQRWKDIYKNMFEYIAIIERGTEGTKRLHLHIVAFGLDYISQSDLEKIWKYGFVDIRQVSDTEGAIDYVLKYVEKTLDGNYIMKGKKFYFTSMGLKKPNVMYLDIEEVLNLVNHHDIGDEAYSFDFESDYVGRCIYTKYKRLMS